MSENVGEFWKCFSCKKMFSQPKFHDKPKEIGKWYLENEGICACPFCDSENVDVGYNN